MEHLSRSSDGRDSRGSHPDADDSGSSSDAHHKIGLDDTSAKITMDGQVSDRFTLEYLEDHVYDKEWSEFVCDNYWSILPLFGPEEIVRACYALASAIGISLEGEPITRDTERKNRIAIMIARIGVNSLSDRGTRSETNLRHISNLDLKADLFLSLGIALFNSSRPVSALENLDFAEVHYMQARRLTKDDPDFCRSMDVRYKCCRAKEAEFLYRMIEVMPGQRRALFANIANSHMAQAVANLGKYGDWKSAEHFYPWLEQCQLDCIRYYDYVEKDIEDLNRDTIEDGYQRWCEETVRFLTLMNEVPHRSSRFAKDEISFPLSERHQWLLDDIVLTYDHCRRILYRIYMIPEEEFSRKGRDEDVESLLDCYARLYTILDKSAKLIDHLFPADGSRQNLHFYQVAETLENSSNPYLRAIHFICTDIFPDRIATSERTFDPRSNVYGIVLKKGFIRNSIMHNTVRIAEESKDHSIYEGVATLTPRELLLVTNWLSYDVREVLLTLQLAVEYRRLNSRGSSYPAYIMLCRRFLFRPGTTTWTSG